MEGGCQGRAMETALDGCGRGEIEMETEGKGGESGRQHLY